jgi:hypothetical protein
VTIDELKTKCTQQEAAELAILHNARIACLKKYKDEPTAAHKRDLDAASSGLDDLVERLSAAYPVVDETAPPDIFPTAKAVAEYVTGHYIRQGGGAVALRTVQGHLAGRGKAGKLLLPRPSGGYTLEAVRDYVARMKYLPAGSDPAVDDDETATTIETLNIQQNIERERLQELRQKNEKLAYELSEKKRLFCRVADLDMEMAARGLALRHFLESHAEEKAAEIMAMDRRDDVVAVIMEGVDDALHDYVSHESYHILVIDGSTD